MRHAHTQCVSDRASCVAAGRGQAGAQTLSGPHHPHHRRLHAGQRDRHFGAHVRAEAQRSLERAGDGREHSGRRRQCRRRARRQVGAGRLHAVLGRERRDDDQSVAAAQSDLRSAARPRADRAAAGLAEHPGGQQRRAGEDRRRADRARQGAARQALLREPRRRHAAAHRRRGVQARSSASTSCTFRIAARTSPT